MREMMLIVIMTVGAVLAVEAQSVDPVRPESAVPEAYRIVCAL